MIHVYVAGEPVPMARPRVVHFGKRVRTFNPRRMVNYERYARVEGMAQYKGQPLHDQALSIKVIVHKRMPKNWSQRKRKRMNRKPVITRPDLDNYCKDLIDAFIGVLYKDDNLMAHLEAWELYGLKPGVDFYVEPVK